MSKTFAVKWARRAAPAYLLGLWYTKWHATKDNGRFTFCGIPVPLGCAGTFFPETDDDLKKVTCCNCLRLLTKDALDGAKRPLILRNGKPSNVLADGTILETPRK